jgi:hypothetical protein
MAMEEVALGGVLSAGKGRVEGVLGLSVAREPAQQILFRSRLGGGGPSG